MPRTRAAAPAPKAKAPKLHAVPTPPPPAPEPVAQPTLKGVLGEVAKIVRLDQFRTNTWNPNRMTEFLFKSLKVDMAESGWPASEALLVWGKDEKGRVQNVIIDGEHRQKAALEIGMTHGPVVVLHGLTERQAKEWTIKLDNKRGSFDRAALADLVREIGQGVDPARLSVSLGFDDAALKALTDARPSLPPSDFRSVDVNAQTTYCCPKCNYEWTGAPK